MTEQQLNEARIQYLMDAGISRSDAQLALDLAKHATTKAVDAMRRVAETAPDMTTRWLVNYLAQKMFAASVEVVHAELTAEALLRAGGLAGANPSTAQH